MTRRRTRTHLAGPCCGTRWIIRSGAYQQIAHYLFQRHPVVHQKALPRPHGDHPGLHLTGHRKGRVVKIVAQPAHHLLQRHLLPEQRQ